MSERLKSTISEDFVRLALSELQKSDLLENGKELQINFDRSSRREMIRKVGLASMIALPVISSLVAPTAAHAQSLKAVLATCSSNGQCASNNCPNNASGTKVCCNPGTGGPAAVNPGAGTCTPVGTCLTTYNTTRCCTQGGTTLLPGCPGGFELCRCD